MQTFIETETQAERVETVRALAEAFKSSAAEDDRMGIFPSEKFQKLKEAGLSILTAPTANGGGQISLYDFALIEEALGSGDAPTALGFGWHLGVTRDLSDRSEEWRAETFNRLMQAIVRDKKLINRAATERNTGSPTRGGRPATLAKRSGQSWIINGRKTFTSLSPTADYFLVSAAVQDTDEIGAFLVPRETSGVRFEKTWHTLGMRSTCSEDMILDQVTLDQTAYAERIGWQDKEHMPPEWLIFIPAVYLGLALGCRQDALKFAANYIPNSLQEPIATLPHVQQKFGEIDLELLQARHLMYGTVRRWDRAEREERKEMGPDFQAVKYAATHAAIHTVQLSMEIVGGQSLYQSLPFERYYRDVCAGLFNPPSNDGIFAALGRRAVEAD
ncbi:MAG: acyl-CoA dehydrogenase family protein [Sporolactobacillus sp.]